jgi:hypothetical protein
MLTPSTPSLHGHCTDTYIILVSFPTSSLHKELLAAPPAPYRNRTVSWHRHHHNCSSDKWLLDPGEQGAPKRLSLSCKAGVGVCVTSREACASRDPDTRCLHGCSLALEVYRLVKSVVVSLSHGKRTLPPHGQASTISGESGPKSLSVILQPTQAIKNKIPTKSSRALPAKCFPSRRSLAFQSQKPNVLTKIPTYIPPLTSSSHQGLAREGGPAPAMLYRTKARRRARLRPSFVIATRTSRFSTGIHSYLYFIYASSRHDGYYH